MDKKLQEELKQRLLKEKKRLEEELEHINKVHLRISQTDMSGEHAYEDDEADVATTTFERERDDSLAWNIKDLLNKINDALEKMKEGSYGICVKCRQEIDIKRLKAIPYATTCIRC